MRLHFNILKLLTLLVLSATIFYGCQTKIIPPEYIYEKDAIHIFLKADKKLNLYDNLSHTLSLCVYQLRNPNAFNQLADNEDGLYRLLECSLFDASVANSKRFIIRPGNELSYTIDRAEGAKYVAIVCGYSTIEKEMMVRMFNVPTTKIKKGWFWNTVVIKPDQMKIELLLGPNQIEKGEGN